MDLASSPAFLSHSFPSSPRIQSTNIKSTTMVSKCTSNKWSTTTIDTDFRSKYGEWALITGASTGLGATYARHLAKNGMNIIAVARRTHLLQTLCITLQTSYPGIKAIPITADLSTAKGVNDVCKESEKYDVGLLINNAGMLIRGKFNEHNEEEISAVINLNILTLTQLTNVFVKRFKTRKQSGILFISSMSSNGTPYLSVYSSSKAYVTCLAYALGEELEKNVDVMVVEPGFVESEMTLGKDENGDGSCYPLIITADQCVVQSLIVFGHGKKRCYTPGFLNCVFRYLLSIFPRRLVMRFWANAIESSPVKPPKPNNS